MITQMFYTMLYFASHDGLLLFNTISLLCSM